MLRTEKRAAFSLALIYAFRMLGLFMILPVFSLYAPDFNDAEPVLIGLAIGIYGLTQGLFQLPFGFMSDRVGRKRMIIIGLLLFCAGSIVAAVAESIHQIIIGRALQGMGAIAAVVMALAADLTREEVRIRIMAVIGMSIGLAFMVSMIMGPILAAQYGIQGIFWITAALALLSLLIVLFITPNPDRLVFHRDAQVSIPDIGRVLRKTELLRLDFGVFMLHLILAATFVLFPLVMRDGLGIPLEQHWQTYLPVFALSILLMLPMIIVAEKKRKLKSMFLLGIVAVIVAEVLLFAGVQYWVVFVSLVIFFAGFNFLEASLPSMVAKIAPVDLKGTAMGLYSTGQFIGAFVGGVLGGYLLSRQDLEQGFLVLGGLTVLWLVVAFFMRNPEPVASRIISLASLDNHALEKFREDALNLPGVKEISVYIEDRIAYLKIDKQAFSDKDLDELFNTNH